MNSLMAKLASSLTKAVIGTARSAVTTSNFVNSTESAFVRSARAKSLNQVN